MSDKSPDPHIDHTTAPTPEAPQAMQSVETGKLADALAKAQKAMEPLQKNKTATISGKSKSGKDFNYSYAYADLPTVIDNLRDALADNGLSYIQRTRIDNNRLMLETRLLHTSGQWISSDWPLSVPDKEDPKQTAALLTYGRRYSLTSLCGVSAEETDDDSDHRRTAEAVKGKLGKAALTKALRSFVDDMRHCVAEGDSDQLEALIGSHRDILEQCKADLYREWWLSDPASDVKGIVDQIKEARRSILKRQQEVPQEPAGSPQGDDRQARRVEASLRACASVENLDAFWATQTEYHKDKAMRAKYENNRAILVAKESKSGKPEESDAPLLMP